MTPPGYIRVWVWQCVQVAMYFIPLAINVIVSQQGAYTKRKNVEAVYPIQQALCLFHPYFKTLPHEFLPYLNCNPYNLVLYPLQYFF